MRVELEKNHTPLDTFIDGLGNAEHVELMRRGEVVATIEKLPRGAQVPSSHQHNAAIATAWEEAREKNRAQLSKLLNQVRGNAASRHPH